MKRSSRPILIASLALAVVCLAVGLFAATRSTQPVVSCGPAPREPVSGPPATLETARDYLAQGDYDYERGDCDKAIAAFTRAIEIDPDFAEAYNNRAYVFMVKKDYAAALPDLDRALQLRPDYVNALMNRGDIHNYYYQIDYDRAVADYDRVLAVDPHAMEYTSVCGHRLLAINHGWSPNVFGNLLTRGVTGGCRISTQ